MYDSFRHSHCLGSSPVIKLRLEGSCASCKAVSCRKGGCAPVSSLHILNSFDLICTLFSSSAGREQAF